VIAIRGDSIGGNAYNIAGMFGNVMKSGYGVLKDGANLAANGGKAIGNSIQVIVGKAYNTNISAGLHHVQKARDYINKNPLLEMTLILAIGILSILILEE